MDPRVTHNNGPSGGHCDHPASYNEAQLVSSCPIRKRLFHGEGPPPELLLVLGKFVCTVLRDPAYIYRKGVNLYSNV